MNSQFILITGPPGIGKTTIVKNITEYCIKKEIKIDGFFTEEVRDNRIRIGFDITSLQGQKTPLARICNGNNNGNKARVGKYQVFPENISSLVLPLLSKPGENIQLMVIDEIGKMEFLCKDFSKAIENIFENSTFKILATIPLNFQNKTLNIIKNNPKSRIINVNHNNRNHILETLIEIIEK